jgi:type IV pilus assembly protein PilP
MNTSKISFLAVSIGLAILCIACNDQVNMSKPSTPEVVSGKISLPLQQEQTASAELKTEIPAQAMPEADNESQIEVPPLIEEKTEYYDAKGKIDPFLPLIQEKIEEPQPVADEF